MITSLQDELGRRSSNPRRPGISMSLMIRIYMGETRIMIMYAWVMEIGFGNLETEGLMVYDIEANSAINVVFRSLGIVMDWIGI